MSACQKVEEMVAGTHAYSVLIKEETSYLCMPNIAAPASLNQVTGRRGEYSAAGVRNNMPTPFVGLKWSTVVPDTGYSSF